MAHEMTHCLLDMDHSLDEHNYMYYADRPSVLEETKAQLLVNIKEYCNVR